MQRLALLGFGALLVALFLGFAIAQGLGNPSVPSDAAAVVEDALDEDLGTVTKAELDRAILQGAAATKVVPVPKPGDDKYDELKETALTELLDSVWILSQAEEMGIAPTPEEVAKEFNKIKNQSFKTPELYEKFLKEAKYTQADVDQRVKIQMISTRIQAAITSEASAPSTKEIEEYYEAAKSSQYTTPESRDIRLIKNKDKAKVEAAKTALEKDDSVKSWKEVAEQYSTDTTKRNGGLQSGVTEGTLPDTLDAAVFAAPQGEVEGPVEEPPTYTVFEVMKITPEKVQTLDEVKSQISSQLAEQLKQETFARFIINYGSLWKSRTFCAPGFLVERCSNFKGDSRPTEANPACYEADPKAPAEACPAPITQIKPAQPGSISPLNLEGQKLPQRPRPAGEEPSGGAAPESLGVPPTGAPTE